MKKGLRQEIGKLLILKVVIVRNIDLMNKGLRLHFVADEVVLYQYGVRNIDLMKKGLRLEYIASCCSPGDIVRNIDLMKKGLRRFFIRPSKMML